MSMRLKRYPISKDYDELDREELYPYEERIETMPDEVKIAFMDDMLIGVGCGRHHSGRYYEPRACLCG